MALSMGRKSIGIELKTSYYNQALKNVELSDEPKIEEIGLLDDIEDPIEAEAMP